MKYLNSALPSASKAEDLWDSILEQQDELPLTDAQKQELDRQSENYQQDPAADLTWEEVKQRLGLLPMSHRLIIRPEAV